MNLLGIFSFIFAIVLIGGHFHGQKVNYRVGLILCATALFYLGVVFALWLFKDISIDAQYIHESLMYKPNDTFSLIVMLSAAIITPLLSVLIGEYKQKISK